MPIDARRKCLLQELDGFAPQDELGPALQFKELVVRDVVVDEQRIAEDVLKHRSDWYAPRAGVAERMDGSGRY